MLRVTVDVNGEEKIRLAAVRVRGDGSVVWYAVEGEVSGRTRRGQVDVEEGASLSEVARAALEKLA